MKLNKKKIVVEEFKGTKKNRKHYKEFLRIQNKRFYTVQFPSFKTLLFKKIFY